MLENDLPEIKSEKYFNKIPNKKTLNAKQQINNFLCFSAFRT